MKSFNAVVALLAVLFLACGKPAEAQIPFKNVSPAADVNRPANQATAIFSSDDDTDKASVAPRPIPAATPVETPVFSVTPQTQAQTAASYAEPAQGVIKQSGNNAWTINFKDEDLQSFVEKIALITGNNYAFPVTLKGKVNITSQTPLTRAELDDLLQSMLHLFGYSIVRSGHINAIQPNEQAKKFDIKFDKSVKTQGQQFIARVIPVKYANLGDLLQALPFFISDYGVIKGFNDVNAVLVADSADNVQKIANLIATIDNPENQAVDIIPLKNTVVGNIMPLLEKLAPRELGASARQTYSPIRIVADEQSNVIVVRGEEAERARIRKLIQEIDKPEEAAGDTQVIYLQNAYAKDMADMLKDFIKGAPNDVSAFITIKADPSINALIIRAPRNYMQEIQGVVAKLDIQPAQVLIEAVIVEVTDDVSDSLGLQYGIADAATGGTLAAASLSTNGVSLGNFLTTLNARPDGTLVNEGVTGLFGGNRFSVLIKALSATNKANLLSTPHITTLDNIEAKIVVGQNVPFKTGTFTTTAAGATNPFTTIDRQDVGITLKVTPQISSYNKVKLKVEQEVSSIEPTITDGASDIITDKRTLNTTVMSDNGGTIVLGGLISDNSSQSHSKVPLLGDIPVLGQLFQSNSKTNDKRNLLIFLRPTVIRSAEDIQTVTTRKMNGLWELSLNTTQPGSVAPPLKPPAPEMYYNPPLKPTPTPPLPWVKSGQQQNLPWLN